MKKYCNNSSYFKFQRNKDVKYKKGFPFGSVPQLISVTSKNKSVLCI